MYTYFTTVTMASADSLTAVINLAPSYRTVYLEVPTFPSVSTLYIRGAEQSGGTFRRICEATDNVNAEFQIDAGQSNKWVRIPAFPFIKVEAASAPSIAITFNIFATQY